MATALDRAIAAELRYITGRWERSLYSFSPEVTMYFVFTHQYGIEAELFHTQEAADAEVIRLKHLSAYRHLNVNVGSLVYDATALQSERSHRLEVVDAF